MNDVRPALCSQSKKIGKTSGRTPKHATTASKKNSTNSVESGNSLIRTVATRSSPRQIRSLNIFLWHSFKTWRRRENFLQPKLRLATRPLPIFCLSGKTTALMACYSSKKKRIRISTFQIITSDSKILRGMDWPWWQELKLEPVRIKLGQARTK